MEAARERPTGKEKGVDDEVRVVQSPTRCPYCHEDVAPDPTAWVACGGCLARHHTGCWGEGGRCGACGATTKLAVVTPPRPTDAELAALLRAGRSADAMAGLRAAGLTEAAAAAELGRVAIAALAKGEPGFVDQAWVTSRACLLLQAVGFLVAGVSLVGPWSSHVGDLGSLFGALLCSGVAAGVPLVAAFIGVGSRLRMALQSVLTAALFLLWLFVAESSGKEVIIGVASLALAVLPAFALWALRRDSHAAR